MYFCLKKVNFPELLKKLRTEKCVSIKKLAPDLDLSYTYISKLENSKSLPSKEVIEKIARYFEYSIDELMISAGKLPKDVEEIITQNPKEALKFLRTIFAESTTRT